MVLPIKRLGDAKQRLATRLAPLERRALMSAMLEDVLAAVQRVETEHDLVVVTGDTGAATAARARGARLIGDPGDAGHSAAALLGIEAALAQGAERVVLIPGDCPLLTTEDLEALLRLPPAGSGRVVVVSDCDGAGTNALLLEPPRVIAPAFGPGSCARHVVAAESAGVPVRIERSSSLALDVDTPADLTALMEVLDRQPDAAPRTAAVLAGLSLAHPAAR